MGAFEQQFITGLDVIEEIGGGGGGIGETDDGHAGGFGDIGGKRITCFPAFRNNRRNWSVYFASRSMMR